MADLEEQEFNDESVQKVVKFMSDGCGCAVGAKGGPCSKQFSNDTVLFNLNNCLELSSGEPSRFLEEFRVLKVTILKFFLRARRKWVFGDRMTLSAKLQTSEQFPTQNFSNYGDSFILTWWCPSQ